MKKINLLILGLMLSTSLVYAQNNLKVYYGLLHAHTMLSDGSGTPEDAYRMAKAAGLNFFAVTEHNHDKAESSAEERKDGVLIATNNSLYNGTANVMVTRKWKGTDGQQHTETISVKPLIKAAKDATTANFLALYGQEFSTISSGNHVNVIGLPEVIKVPNGNFKAFFDLLKNYESTTGIRAVVQMNHPDVHNDLFYTGTKSDVTKNMFNDYGIDATDIGPDFKDLVKVNGQYTHLIELLTGPALSDVPKKYDVLEDDYFFYLTQGFRVSPSAGQDNHYKTWGTITDARIGVLSASLAEKDILDAIRQNRTFATQDKNLKVTLQVNGSLMGSSINAPVESELKFNVAVSDADEPNAKYDIEIIGGKIHPQLSTQATEWKAKDAVLMKKSGVTAGNITLNGVFANAEPSFYYARVTQTGKDQAWTSPVWVNGNAQISNLALAPATLIATPVEATFYWTASASSHVYHKKGCKSVDLISAENLRSGDTPPEGRTLHNCIIQSDNNEP